MFRSVRRFFPLLLAGLVLAGAPATSASTSGAEWLPFKGTYANAIGCTWKNGCHGGYHGYPAIDFMVAGGTPVYAAGSGTVTLAVRGCLDNGSTCGTDNLARSKRKRCLASWEKCAQGAG